jgi:hypothetical protein
MKIYSVPSLVFLLLSLLLVSCSTTLNKEKFYSDKKVGIIFETFPLSVKEVNSGNYFIYGREGITQKMLRKINLNEAVINDSLKKIVIGELEKNNKEFIEIDEKEFSYSNLTTFRKPKDHKTYPKKDFRIYKTYGVDEIIYVRYEIGLIYNYVNGIYIGKKNAYSAKLYIVDLSDNSFIQYEIVEKAGKSFFKRDDESENNLKILNDEMNAIFVESLRKIKEKY